MNDTDQLQSPAASRAGPPWPQCACVTSAAIPASATAPTARVVARYIGVTFSCRLLDARFLIRVEAFVETLALVGHLDEQLRRLELRAVFLLQRLGELHEFRSAHAID